MPTSSLIDKDVNEKNIEIYYEYTSCWEWKQWHETTVLCWCNADVKMSFHIIIIY